MILFIDDEKKYVDNIITELELLHVRLRFCSDVDVALKILAECEESCEGIICDVMMPHGSAFSIGETEENRTTGTLFLKRIRGMGISLPVVLLTNVERNYRHNLQIEEAASSSPPCIIIRKRQHASFEVAEMIVEFFKNQ
jgi:CheY-like chemotaxis protein